MIKITLSVIVCLAVLTLAALALLTLGFFPTRAKMDPPRFEVRVANQALHASMRRYAPRVTDPLTPSDQNLIDGMKIYYENCSLCHGGLDGKPAPLANNFYPPAPNLISNPLGHPEWQIFFAIRTGVRYTAMPAWEGVLSDPDIWKVTSFLARLEKLPPGVQQYWKDTFNGAPPVAGENHAEMHAH
jgi:mono/diheme cytochrome c family protein